MPAFELKNEMILASAGSGKTFQLTNRFIALMAMGVSPERIIALTFTRKAAGEFFQAILEKLASAAMDSNRCKALAEGIGIPQLNRELCLQLLEKLVTNMHRLHLGTLDSFFVRIIRSFPFEFGLGGGFEIIDGHALSKAKSRVYGRVFRRGGQREFFQAFKRATFGKEESSLLSILNRFVKNTHELLLEAPEGEKWGEPKAIWPPRPQMWIPANTDLYPDAFEQLFEALGREELTDKHWERWTKFRDGVLKHRPGAPLGDPVKYVLGKLQVPEVWQSIYHQDEDASVTFDRKAHRLSPEACEQICCIVVEFVAREFANRMVRTKGVWEVLSQYEGEYGEAVRDRGKLTFFDLQLILSGNSLEGANRPALSQVPGENERLQIDFRLDGKFDHWLLDEFQDTNFHQWCAVQNLIDEVVQDTSDQRSLFQVGDVKQAIYGWRGGDVRLFSEILDRYNSHETRIHERPLNDSWRSGPEVIEMVNQVFGQLRSLEKMFPKAAIERWVWSPHRSRRKELEGYACLLHPQPISGRDQKETRMLRGAARHRVVLEILNLLQPAERGLTCAILVQTNNECHAVAEFLRARSKHRVLDESDVNVVGDSPAAGAMLALLQFAAHPGDSLARWHVLMSPFKDVLRAMNLGEPALVRRVLGEVSRHGFEHFLRAWARRLSVHGGIELDEFNTRRVEQLAEAAQVFDEEGDRDIDAFLEYARQFTVRDPVSAGVVQVMTIHKSKGLGFDVVILPELQGESLDTFREGIGVKRDTDRQIQWVLEMPPKEIVMADQDLVRYQDSRRADECYEEFCKLYVAMTRAKRAMYVITDPPSERNGSSNNFPKLLASTLTVGSFKPIKIGTLDVSLNYGVGDWEWFAQLHAKGEPEAGGVDADPEREEIGFEPRPHLPRRTPSGSESHAVTSYELFSRGGKRAREFGTAVHALFEHIPWLDELDDAQLAEAFAKAPVPEEIREPAIDHVLHCLGGDEVREALSRPSADAECWLERKFELVMGGEWISGTFDRVVVESGKATILDFKTDRVVGDEEIEQAVAGYRPQLKLYRDVLSRLTGLPDESIACRLLFTRLRRVVEVLG